MEKNLVVVSNLDNPELLLHSVPCLRAIQKTHTDAEICLVISEHSEELCEILPAGFTIHCVENADTANVDAISKPSVYYQLGSSEQSLALSAKIKGETNVGAHYISGELRLENDWDAYIAQLQTSTQYNPFHRVELLRNSANQIGIESDFELVAPTDLQIGISKYFQGEHIKLGIALDGQNPEELRAAIQSILQLDLRLKIYLLGTVKDRRLSNTLMESIASPSRVVELTGRLGLGQTAAFAQACDIVIAVPGLFTTMAAGFGTFCIALDSTQGESCINYPYGHGHLIVQRNHAALSTTEFGDLIADLVAHAVLGAEGNIPNQANWENYFDGRVDSILGKVRVFITQRVQEALSDGSTRTDLKLHPLLFTGATSNDCLRSFYRLLWEQTLSGYNISTHEVDILEEQTLGTLTTLLTPMEQLCELTLFGQKYTSMVAANIASGELDTAKLNSNRLQELDDLIGVFANTHPYLAPICQYLFIRHGQSRAATVPEIASELAAAYRGAQLQVLILLDLYKSLFQNTYDQETRSLHG